MLLQLIINALHLQGNALRFLFLVPAVLFVIVVLFLKCFPGAASFASALFAGAAYPAFLFLTAAVRPYSEQKEGALRLAMILEVLLLALAFWNSRVSLPRTVLAVTCVYMLSWLFFSKIPVSFTAMSDFLYLIVPCGAALFFGAGAAGGEEEEDPEMRKIRLQAEFELRNRERNRTEVNGVEVFSDPDGTVREARDRDGCYTRSGSGWKEVGGSRLSRREMEEKGLDRFT